MSLNYAQEKAYKVLQSLGSCEGTLQERILAAVMPSFRSLVDEAEQKTAGLHEELMAELVALYETHLCDQAAVGDEGPISATIDALSGQELDEVANRMVSLCIEVMQQQGKGAMMLGTKRGEATDSSM